MESTDKKCKYLKVKDKAGSEFLCPVDDVDFILDDSARLIHFRSASRTGHYDFGVNRRRMKEISDRYLRLAENEG